MSIRILFAAFALCLASVLWADEPRDPEIEATITAQIEAFKVDDFAAAFAYASPSIQGMFQTPERFGQMVRQGYPMVWRPAEVRYLELREIAGALWQRVQITDERGELHFLDYRMSPGADGWKISGVQILRAPGVAA